MITKMKANWKERKKVKKDVTLAKSQGMAQGYLLSTEENINSIKVLNKRVEDLSKELSETESRIRGTYKKQQEETDKKQKSTCDICKQGIDAERIKLISLQNEFKDAIEEFLLFEKRLNRFVSKFELTFNMMLQGTGKLKNSEEELSLIARDFKKFAKTKENLIEMNTNIS